MAKKVSRFRLASGDVKKVLPAEQSSHKLGSQARKTSTEDKSTGSEYEDIYVLHVQWKIFHYQYSNFTIWLRTTCLYLEPVLCVSEAESPE